MRTGGSVALPRAPDQSARGLAQSKTLARMAMAHVNAKRLGLRWPSTAFPKDVSSPTSFGKQNRHIIYGNALATRCGWDGRALTEVDSARPPQEKKENCSGHPASSARSRSTGSPTTLLNEPDIFEMIISPRS